MQLMQPGSKTKPTRMHCVIIESYTEATEGRPTDVGEGCARGFLLSAYYLIPHQLSAVYQPAQTGPYEGRLLHDFYHQHSYEWNVRTSGGEIGRLHWREKRNNYREMWRS